MAKIALSQGLMKEAKNAFVFFKMHQLRAIITAVLTNLYEENGVVNTTLGNQHEWFIAEKSDLTQK